MYRKIIYILLSLVLIILCGCSNESINNTIKEANKIDEQVEVKEENEDLFIISDIKKWKHPTKDIFEEEKYEFGELVNVELYNKKTYPIFYVKLSSSFLYFSNKEYFDNLIKCIAKSNGYWDFEIKDVEDKITIDVYNNVEKTKVIGYKINQYEDFNDFLVNVRDKKFNEYLLSSPKDEIESNIIASGDIDRDRDGVKELIIKYKDNYTDYRDYDLFLVRINNNKYENLGRLIDSYSVSHVCTGVEIKSLDGSNKKYIIVYIEHEMASTKGYFIYDYINKSPKCIFINFPGATAFGRRELMDYDKDGIVDHVNYYDYFDVQQHTVISYESFGGDKCGVSVIYNNKIGQFFYPKNPEDVVKSYIEATCLVDFNAVDYEKEQFITQQKLIDIKLDYKPNISTYNGIELTLIRMNSTDDNIIVEVTEDDIYEEKKIINWFYLQKFEESWKIYDIKKVNE